MEHEDHFHVQDKQNTDRMSENWHRFVKHGQIICSWYSTAIVTHLTSQLVLTMKE
jgi:hypothetical protein